MRSLLFAPADNVRKLDKAFTSGADALIVDLEDSVAAPRKIEARTTATEFLARTTSVKNRPTLMVRVNGLETGLIDGDLDAVIAGRPDAIMLPKTEGAPSVIHLDAKLAAREAQHGLPAGQIGIVALTTETAASLFVAGTYRGASARLFALTWGAEDLSADLGAETNRDSHGNFLAPYQLARTLCLAGAAAARIPAIDTVYVDFRDDDGVRRAAEEARRDGFIGKLAVHPSQVPIINEVFTPSAADVARAQAIVAAFKDAADGAGVVAIDGVMYDRPHLTRAERLLARAPQAES